MLVKQKQHIYHLVGEGSVGAKGWDGLELIQKPFPLPSNSVKIAFNFTERTLSLHVNGLLCHETRLSNNEACVFLLMWLHYPNYASDAELLEFLYTNDPIQLYYDRYQAPKKLEDYPSQELLKKSDAYPVSRVFVPLKRKLEQFNLKATRVLRTGFILESNWFAPEVVAQIRSQQFFSALGSTNAESVGGLNRYAAMGQPRESVLVTA